MASSKAPLPIHAKLFVLERSHRRVSGYSCPMTYKQLTKARERCRKDPGGYELCAKCGKVLTADKNNPDVYVRVPIFNDVFYEYSCQDCDQPVKDLLISYPHLEPTIKLLLKVHRKYLGWLFAIPEIQRQPKTWGKLRLAQRRIECCECPFLSVEHRTATPDEPNTMRLSTGIFVCAKYEKKFLEIDHENWMRAARFQEDDKGKRVWFRAAGSPLIDDYSCRDLKAQLDAITYSRAEYLPATDVREFLERVAPHSNWNYSRSIYQVGQRVKPKAHLDGDAPEDEGDTERYETQHDWRGTVSEHSNYLPYYSDIVLGGLTLPGEGKEEQIPADLDIDSSKEVGDELLKKDDYSRWKKKILAVFAQQQHDEKWILYDPFFATGPNLRKVQPKRYYDPTDCDPWRSILGKWIERIPRKDYTWGVYPKYESDKHYLADLIALTPAPVSGFLGRAKTKDSIYRSQPNLGCPVSGFVRHLEYIAAGASVQPCWWPHPCKHRQPHNKKAEVEEIPMTDNQEKETNNTDYGVAWAKLCISKLHPVVSLNGKCTQGKHESEPFTVVCRACRYEKLVSVLPLPFERWRGAALTENRLVK